MKKFKKKVKNIVPKDLFYVQAELDYHGTDSLNPYDIEKMLTEFLEDCYIAKFDQVLIITGKGRVVKPIVNKLLKSNKFVQSFKMASQNHGGEGAFEVSLS